MEGICLARKRARGLSYYPIAHLDLPAEIIAEVAELLAGDTSTLANLALVNIECRQIARTAQFADVTFDYSPRSHALLRKLIDEISEGQQDTTRRPIGACIRRITMEYEKYWATAGRYDPNESTSGESPESFSHEQRQEPMRKIVTYSYTNGYRALLLKAVAVAMPNLHAIAWGDEWSVDEPFFHAISQSPVRHLKLYQTPIDSPHSIQVLRTLPSWPLRSLYLEVRVSFSLEHEERGQVTKADEADQADAFSVFTGSLLRLCAPTLESLVWNDHWNSFGDSSSIGPLSFPRLRRFRSRIPAIAPATVISVLSPSLKELELGYMTAEQWLSVARSFEHKPLTNLRSLVLDRPESWSTAHIVTLLANHTFLQKLHVAKFTSIDLNEKILPILSNGHFTKLTSLSLHWGTLDLEGGAWPRIARIPEASLVAIGWIYSLQQLRLGAGEQYSYACE